jgi:hypothetical protein
MLVHNRTLLNRILGRRVAYDILDGVGAAGPADEVVVCRHFELLNAGPVGAKGKEVGAVCGFLEDVGVDEVVACVLGEADGAVVGPGAGGKGGGGCDADFGVLGVDEGDGVVAIICVSTLGDGGCLYIVRKLLWQHFYARVEVYPDILVVAKVYASSVLQDSASIGPRALQELRSRDADVAASCKTPVCSVLEDDARVVYP